METYFGQQKILYIEQNNSLRYLRILITKTKVKPVKMFSYFLLLYHLSILIWELYLMFESWNKQFIIQYSPSFLITIIMVSKVVIVLTQGKKLRLYNKILEKNCYSLDMAKKRTKQRILRESNQMKYIFGTSLFLSFMTGVSHVIQKKDEWDLFLCVLYFRKQFPSHSDLLVFTFYILYLCLYFYMVYDLGVLTYFSMQINFQIYILNDCIMGISERRYNGLRLPYNFYQKRVLQRLKFCLEYQEFILSNARTMVQNNSGTISYFVFLLYAVSITALINIYWSPVKNYPRICIQTASLIFSTVVGIEVAHKISEEAANIHYRWEEVPWYTWNLENQKNLLITLSSSRKVLNFGLFNVLTLNRTLVSYILKLVWSVFTVFVNIDRRSV